MAVLSELDKKRRKEVIQAATNLNKSGIKPTPALVDPNYKMSKKELRRLQRAMGYRGSKAKRHNIERQTKKLQQVLMVEEALDAAQERMDHPLRSRLKRG